MEALFLLMCCLMLSNSIYTRFYYRIELKESNAETIMDLDSLQYVSDVLYFAESSNSNNNPSDTCKWSIAQMIDTLSSLRVHAIEHGAIHAKTYLELIRNIEEDAPVQTLVVTMNLRSFGPPWIYSHLENALMKGDVFYEPIPAIGRRLKLAFGILKTKTNKERDEQVEWHWQHDKLPVPDTFPYKNVRQWDNAQGNGTYLLPDGKTWDMPKIELACHYIKNYGFSIDTSTNPRVKDFDAIVNLAKQQNRKLVFNLLAENTAYADSLVGPVLTNLIRSNRDILKKRYQQMGVDVIDNLEVVRGVDFNDQKWTTEHYAQTGRWTIAQNVANYLSKVLKIKK